MKRFFVFLFCFFLVVLPVSAAEVYEPSEDVDEPSMTIRVIDSSEPLDVFVTGEQVYSASADEVGVVTQTLEPITPSNTTGLKKIMITLIGDYESIVTDYRYQNTNGTWQYLREIQPDYVWLVSAGIFAIVLWCTLRAGVYFVCKR